MRRAILVAAILLLGACNNRGNWENEQAELANELNASTSETNAVNATAPAANEINATTGNAAENDVNAAAPANEATPKS
jgi:hypothetical protein